MNDEIYQNYKLAGKIAAGVRDYGVGLIKPGASYLEVVNNIESKILDKGAGLAFPVNISVDEIAAHFSPKHNDTLVFKKGDVVKLDIGTHVNGYIADTAITVEVKTNNQTDMIKASSDALNAAIDVMKAGVNLVEIGRVVEKTIKSYGYKPVDNLTGHSLQRYIIHAGISIPNVPDIAHNAKPKTGDVLAIEPFATDGAGHVISGAGSNIYRCKESYNPRLIRDKRINTVFNQMRSKFKTLPFAQRWFEKHFSSSKITLRKLAFLGIIRQYPQLIDAKNGIVTQKEHTVILNNDGCEVIT